MRLIIVNEDPLPEVVSGLEGVRVHELESPNKNRVMGLRVDGDSVTTQQRVDGEEWYSELNRAVEELNRSRYYLVSLKEVQKQLKTDQKLRKIHGVGYGLIIGTLLQCVHLYLIIRKQIQGGLLLNLVPLFIMTGAAYTILKKGNGELYH